MRTHFHKFLPVLKLTVRLDYKTDLFVRHSGTRGRLEAKARGPAAHLAARQLLSLCDLGLGYYTVLPYFSTLVTIPPARSSRLERLQFAMTERFTLERAGGVVTSVEKYGRTV